MSTHLKEKLLLLKLKKATLETVRLLVVKVNIYLQ